MKKKVQYSDAEEGGSLDDLSKRLASDLRKHVRRLAPVQLFSQAWIDMVDSLQHVTNIALMEQRLPKKSDDGTLWERDELTVRFVLEEGKLNLALRLLSDLREFQMNDTRAEVLQRAAENLKSEPSALESRVRIFEQSLGLLVNCALRSVESLQTADMPLLIGHILSVVSSSSDTVKSQYDKGDIEKMQESQVLYYLLHIGRKLEELDETKVMELLRDKAVLSKVIRYLRSNHEYLRRTAIDAGLEALAMFMGAEDFATYRAAFLPSSDIKEDLVKLKDATLEGVKEDFETRRKLRPLLDQIDKAAREL